MSRIQLQNDEMDEQKILEEIYRKIEPGKAAPKPGSLYAKGPEIAQHSREIEAKISLEQERIAKEFGKSLEILSSREKVENDIVLVDGEGKLKRQILQAGSISRNSKFWDPLTICYVNIQAKTESGFVFIDEMVEEYSFVLGRANEAKGLELAVARMNLGERSMIYCQPEYGYMSSKRPQNISKDDVLIFDVCLLRTEKDSPYWEMSSDQLIQKAEK